LTSTDTRDRPPRPRPSRRPDPRTQPLEATAAVPIDPRIRARRIEVQRDAGRRRLRRLVDVGLVLLVVAGFVGALRSPLLDVGVVRVRGAERTTSDQVAAASGIRRGEPLMDVDLHAAGERIAALPWVGRVTLHRELGGTVDIRLTERTPAAVLGSGSSALIVDDEGRVLARATDLPDVAGGLVHVLGLPTHLAPGAFVPARATSALALAGRLATAVPGAIAQVAVGEDLTATLTQGGDVRFGDTTRLSAKLRSLQTMLDKVDLSCLGVLDLRTPATPVLTRRSGCS
jgi:cell division protein FtsQ